LLATLSACPASSDPSRNASPPNIVVIVIDTARLDHFSYTGWIRATTPHIDAFLNDAVNYTNARSVSPWTLPSHMSMFTGLLPGEHGAHWGANPLGISMDPKHFKQDAPGIARPKRMFPRRLQELGYTTLAISNNLWVSPDTGFDEGFDYFYQWEDMVAARPALREFGLQSGLPAEMLNGKAGLSLLMLRKHAAEHELKEPFLIFVNLIDLHYPYFAPITHAIAFGGKREDYRAIIDPRNGKSEIRIIAGAEQLDYAKIVPFYDGALHYVDGVVGGIFSWLRSEGTYDRSMIIVTSDHGEHLGENGRFSHQLSVEEELLRIPLLIKYPDNKRAGTEDDNPYVSSLDLYRTILSAGTADRSDLDQGSLSQDLSEPNSFERSWALAEYYYSDRYLQNFVYQSPDFDIESHKTVRRVLYSRGQRHVFHDLNLASTEAMEPGTTKVSPDGEASRWLKAYVGRIDEKPALKRSSKPQDPMFLEGLKQLGYVADPPEALEPER
jgi:arylsulfatase A-like enzyme